MDGVFFRLFDDHHRPGVRGQRVGRLNHCLIHTDRAELFPQIAPLSWPAASFRHALIFELQGRHTSGVVVHRGGS